MCSDFDRVDSGPRDRCLAIGSDARDAATSLAKEIYRGT